jgi:hypothetical protein
MAEVGLVQFGQVAPDMAQATVLALSHDVQQTHQFTQPQLLAILYLMRYEDWTSEVRLAEHSRIAPRLAAAIGPRLHASVPLPATTGRSRHHSHLERSGAPHGTAHVLDAAFRWRSVPPGWL